MSSDRKKFECLKVLAALGQYVLQDKRDPVRIAKIAQSIISERKQEERQLDINHQTREVIDKLILRTMSGEIQFVETWISNGRIRSWNGITCDLGDSRRCDLRYERGNEDPESASYIRLLLDDGSNEFWLPLDCADQKFFFDLMMELRHKRDSETLSHFA